MTFHGPHPEDPFSTEHLQRVLFAGEAVTMVNPRGPDPIQFEHRVQTLVPGRARAPPGREPHDPLDDHGLALPGSLTLEDILRDHIVPLGVRAWHGSMVGHLEQQFTLAQGVEAEIDAGTGTIRMLEPAVV